MLVSFDFVELSVASSEISYHGLAHNIFLIRPQMLTTFSLSLSSTWIDKKRGEHDNVVQACIIRRSGTWFAYNGVYNGLISLLLTTMDYLCRFLRTF